MKQTHRSAVGASLPETAPEDKENRPAFKPKPLRARLAKVTRACADTGPGIGQMPASWHPPPAGLAEVALVGAETCAAVGEMSPSWWRAEVHAGRAPRPVIQQKRCTRWAWSDVRRFWAELAVQQADSEARERMVASAKKASTQAAEARKAREAARQEVAE